MCKAYPPIAGASHHRDPDNLLPNLHDLSGLCAGNVSDQSERTRRGDSDGELGMGEGKI